MTIAACYLAPEGVVFGADSTTTVTIQGQGPTYYRYGQKIFEVGTNSTLGLMTWGYSGLGALSYRTLLGRFADQIAATPATTMAEVANDWAKRFWEHYVELLRDLHQEATDLEGKEKRTPEEDDRYWNLRFLASGGFCLAGHRGPDRNPEAFEITFDLSMNTPTVQPLPMGRTFFWGMPNVINRVLLGIDQGLFSNILSSGKWQGTEKDLLDLVRPFTVQPALILPIREAVDWLYSSIHTTIKAMKFAHMPPACGGPIEVAVVTTDRPFRWVCHKRLDAGIETDPRWEQ